jgi:dephospho-CoA kinase
MLRIGLTGGIGSGKSTVARLLSERGASVVDADAVSRQLTAPGGKALPEIAKQLGDGVMHPDGSMDRDAVRALILQRPAARRQLEAIVHPLVGQETTRLANQAVDAGSNCVVFDIPLLVESTRWRPRLDAILVVDCHNSTQIERVLARESGRLAWTAHAVEQIIAVQASRAQRLAAADICIYNEGISLDVLAQVVDEVAASFGL